MEGKNNTNVQYLSVTTQMQQKAWKNKITFGAFEDAAATAKIALRDREKFNKYDGDERTWQVDKLILGRTL
jgi:hypothetical protein